MQYISEQIWIRWKREYIYEQHKRNKWMYPSRNVSVGDIVLMKNNSIRNTWPLAIVSKTIPNDDGLVRRVILRLMQNSPESHNLERESYSRLDYDGSRIFDFFCPRAVSWQCMNYLLFRSTFTDMFKKYIFIYRRAAAAVS